MNLCSMYLPFWIPLIINSREIDPLTYVLCWHLWGRALENNIFGVKYGLLWRYSLVDYTDGGDAVVILVWDYEIHGGTLGCSQSWI